MINKALVIKPLLKPPIDDSITVPKLILEGVCNNLLPVYALPEGIPIEIVNLLCNPTEGKSFLDKIHSDNSLCSLYDIIRGYIFYYNGGFAAGKVIKIPTILKEVLSLGEVNTKDSFETFVVNIEYPENKHVLGKVLKMFLPGCFTVTIIVGLTKYPPATMSMIPLKGWFNDNNT